MLPHQFPVIHHFTSMVRASFLLLVEFGVLWNANFQGTIRVFGGNLLLLCRLRKIGGAVRMPRLAFNAMNARSFFLLSLVDARSAEMVSSSFSSDR